MVCLANQFGKLWSLRIPEICRRNLTSPRVRSFAQKCMNKGGRYIALAELGERHRRGVVMILEGKSSAGW